MVLISEPNCKCRCFSLTIVIVVIQARFRPLTAAFSLVTEGRPLLKLSM